jgi:hypothetical protein
MRRTLPILALAGLAAAAVGLAVWPPSSPGQPDKQPAAPAARASDPRLPISKAILFTSGVAYFQRDGEVEGDTSVVLSFPVQDINDLLKSLVLRDRSGGQISAVGYDSFDPVAKTLQSFAVNLSDNPSYAQVLNQARGEKVEVTWRPSDRPATQVKGTIMGVETQKQPAGKDVVVEVGLLNLWAADGMRSFKLAEVGQVRFLNPVIDSEVKRALDVLARGHDRQKKTLSLSFRGQGKRQVQVGYVVEHPIWKTSYRLVLSEQKGPLLQGWAMVENPTAEDWNKVHVQLVSGRPISFRMDLYQPLYVPRPLVQLEIYAGLLPRAYGADRTFTPVGATIGSTAGSTAPGPKEEAEKAKDKGIGSEKKELMPPEAKAGPGRVAGGALPGGPPAPPMDDLADSVPTAARGVKLGEAFQYVVEQPVSLPRQKSALLPIVNADIEATRVSIYNEKVQAAHPLLGLRLKNTTGLHLMQGPISVFDAGSYAGDALIRDLQPDEDRLLSYAVDQGVEVKVEAKKEPDKVVAIKISKGIVERTYKLRDTKTYQIKNRADRDRLVILEHPDHSPEYKLVKPSKKPKVSRDAYRFEVRVPRGAFAAFPVVEERELLDQVALTNMDDNTVAVLLQGPVSPALKAAVQKAIELKNRVAATNRQIEDVRRQLATVREDQKQQRENMKVIPQTDPVYKKYLDKFLAQETQVERLRGEQERLQATLERQRQEYERHVANLTVKE